MEARLFNYYFRNIRKKNTALQCIGFVIAEYLSR